MEVPLGNLAREVAAVGAHSLLVVRHGRTSWNDEDRLTTSTDIPLNGTGEAQALALADALAGAEFDFASASPLQRAMRTAQLGLRHATHPGVVADERLVEPAAGPLLEGRCFGEFATPGPLADMYFAYADELQPVYPQGAETIEQSAARAGAVLNDVYARPGRHFIATHGAFARVLACVFLGLHPGSYRRWRLDNCHAALFKLHPSPPHQLSGWNLPAA